MLKFLANSREILFLRNVKQSIINKNPIILSPPNQKHISNCLVASLHRYSLIFCHVRSGFSRKLKMFTQYISICLTAVMRLENAHRRFTLRLTTVSSRFAIRHTHICDSMALTLSPQKYFSGKFCFNCLNSYSIMRDMCVIPSFVNCTL